MKKITIILILTAGLFLVSLCAQDYAPQQEEAIVLPTVEYKADSFKDPFIKGYVEDKEEQAISGQPVEIRPLPALTVQGLIWGSETPQAIINNKVLKIGDVLPTGTDDAAGVKIMGINKTGVEVFYYGKSYFVSSPASTATGGLQPTTENQNTGR